MEQPNGGVGEPSDDRSASPSARATQNNNAAGMGPLSGISNGVDTAAKTTNWVKFEEEENGGAPDPSKVGYGDETGEGVLVGFGLASKKRKGI